MRPGAPRDRCPCGRPLHYASPKLLRRALDDNRLRGEHVHVSDADGRVWEVPRHYVNLHVIALAELPQMARRYGFQQVV